MIRALVAATALASVLAVVSEAQAATPSPFSGVTVFGDSLSDGGNLSLAEGLPQLQRFTTNPGLTTVENLAAFYGLPLTPSLLGGTNYAFGGAGVNSNAPGTPAGVPTVTQQIDAYLATNPTIGRTELYTVLGGANDIFYNAASVAAAAGAQAAIAQIPAGTPPAIAAAIQAAIVNQAESTAGVSVLETQAQATAAVTGAATQELTLIGALQKAGARYIVVFNLPDIGKTPMAAAEDAASPGAKEFLTSLSLGFNTALNTGLGAMKTGIVPVNTYALLNEILASPATYGFVNTTVPACTVSTSLLCTPATLVNPTAPSNFVFADGVHPTTATHAEFAQALESELVAPQQISLLAEVPIATLDSERGAVRSELLYDQAAGATGVRMFANGGYLRNRISAETYTPSAHDDDGLITVGADLAMANGLTVGGEISGGEATESMNGQLRHFTVDSVLGSLFAQYVYGPAYVSAEGGVGGLSFNDIQRSFKIGPATRVETGTTGGSTSLVDLAAGYWFGGRALRAGPFVSATYERVHVNGYGEPSGDSTSMTFGDQNREAAVGEAGLRLQATLPTGYALLRPYAEAGYAYDADARTRYVTAGLTTMNGEFALPGFSPDKDWGDVQVGVNAEFRPGLVGYVAYQGRFDGRSESYNGADVGLRYAF